mmetsp:Transcript_52567/g.123453  ORF Transcript_52567/g.123453 Transcript_52567/m.123453 type:complete len:208 (+) Transcript_52567:277-900(+)
MARLVRVCMSVHQHQAGRRRGHCKIEGPGQYLGTISSRDGSLNALNPAIGSARLLRAQNFRSAAKSRGLDCLLLCPFQGNLTAVGEGSRLREVLASKGIFLIWRQETKENHRLGGPQANVVAPKSTGELIHANVAVTIIVEALKGCSHHHTELPKGEVLLGAHHSRQQIAQSLHEVLARDLLLAVLAEHVVDALRIRWIQTDLVAHV